GSSAYGRDDLVAVGGERLAGLVVHQVDGELVGAEPGQLAQPVDVRACRAEQAEPVDNGIGHEVGGGVVGPAVMGVVVTLPALDVVGQLVRHRPVHAVPGDQVGHVVADHAAEPAQLVPLVWQVGADVGGRGHAHRDRGRIAAGRLGRGAHRADRPLGDVRV